MFTFVPYARVMVEGLEVRKVGVGIGLGAGDFHEVYGQIGWYQKLTDVAS